MIKHIQKFLVSFFYQSDIPKIYHFQAWLKLPKIFGQTIECQTPKILGTTRFSFSQPLPSSIVVENEKAENSYAFSNTRCETTSQCMSVPQLLPNIPISNIQIDRINSPSNESMLLPLPLPKVDLEHLLAMQLPDISEQLKRFRKILNKRSNDEKHIDKEIKSEHDIEKVNQPQKGKTELQKYLEMIPKSLQEKIIKLYFDTPKSDIDPQDKLQKNVSANHHRVKNTDRLISKLQDMNFVRSLGLGRQHKTKVVSKVL